MRRAHDEESRMQEMIEMAAAIRVITVRGQRIQRVWRA
jgi:hypothetical protein